MGVSLACLRNASYKMEDTLHASVQVSSGNGKAHLITRLASMMPEGRCDRLEKNNRQ